MSRRSKHKAQGMWLGNQHAVKTEHPTVTEEQIRHRAYELYLARGEKPGDPVQDWVQAEKELRMGLVQH